jgi:ATP-binding cassette subfamily C protein
MEEGVDTVVGERGSKLSGGQRQRLALARAIVHGPALLILDEATSALDKETEKAILKTIKGLSGQMSVLAISHNPALIEAADHVYYLRDGMVERSKDKVYGS